MQLTNELIEVMKKDEWTSSKDKTTIFQEEEPDRSIVVHKDGPFNFLFPVIFGQTLKTKYEKEI